MSKPKTPNGLASPGRRLWLAVVDEYELRADEMLLLEKACRSADDVARLEAELADAPLLTVGSTGQQRANPLLAEVRGMRALLASLLKQLRLPTTETDADTDASTSAKARKAARARWGNPQVGSRGA